MENKYSFSLNFYAKDINAQLDDSCPILYLFVYIEENNGKVSFVHVEPSFSFEDDLSYPLFETDLEDQTDFYADISAIKGQPLPVKVFAKSQLNTFFPFHPQFSNSSYLMSDTLYSFYTQDNQNGLWGAYMCSTDLAQGFDVRVISPCRLPFTECFSSFNSSYETSYFNVPLYINLQIRDGGADLVSASVTSNFSLMSGASFYFSSASTNFTLKSDDMNTEDISLLHIITPVTDYHAITG